MILSGKIDGGIQEKVYEFENVYIYIFFSGFHTQAQIDVQVFTLYERYGGRNEARERGKWMENRIKSYESLGHEEKSLKGREKKLFRYFARINLHVYANCYEILCTPDITLVYTVPLSLNKTFRVYSRALKYMGAFKANTFFYIYIFSTLRPRGRNKCPTKTRNSSTFFFISFLTSVWTSSTESMRIFIILSDSFRHFSSTIFLMFRA